MAGVQHNTDQVWELAAMERPRLSWKREPDNPHDKNAIAIFDVSGRDQEIIGYVDRELATDLMNSGQFDELSIRFEGANVDAYWVEVTYQVTGPKGGKQAFLDSLEDSSNFLED